MTPGDPANCRQWIADCIVAGAVREPPTLPLEQVLATAEREGVSGLLLRPLAAFEWDAPGRQALEHARRTLAMRELAGLAETRRVLSPLADAGLPFLVLKGNALAYWLYASPMERPRVDVDLLVESESAALRVARVLERAGFRSVDGAMPGRVAEFEIAMQRAEGAAGAPAIDLHWHLVNHARLASALPFDALWAASIPIPGLHPAARGLGRIHALLHALLHRVTNIPSGRQDRLVWLHDIHLLSSGCSDAEWQSFLRLGIDKRIATPCLDGLRASKLAFQTRIPAGIEQALASASSGESWDLARMDAGAMDRAHLSALPWSQKIRWLRHKLLPSPEFMRYRYGVRGTLALARAYFMRLWVGVRRGSGW